LCEVARDDFSGKSKSSARANAAEQDKGDLDPGRKRRTDSPCYPSMRLFRPRAEGDWDYVFDAASVELMKLARLI
jgi:hypothetical protein